MSLGPRRNAEVGAGVEIAIENGSGNPALALVREIGTRVNQGIAPGVGVPAGTTRRGRSLERKAASDGGISTWTGPHQKSLPLGTSTMAKSPASCSLAVLSSLKDSGIGCKVLVSPFSFPATAD